MQKTLLHVDPKLKPWEQTPPLHNRWHPEIPPVATVKEGDVFRVETVDWTGGQIKNDDSADDADLRTPLTPGTKTKRRSRR